jgi:hypothetical protein
MTTIAPGRGLRKRLRRAVRAADLPAGPGDPTPVTEDDLAPLPAPARRWMRAAGVVGVPRTWSFRVQFCGEFQPRRHGAWMRAEAWQYSSALAPARVYMMRIDVSAVLPMFGVDSYVRGRGRMHGKALGLVTVADGAGPEFDISELSTYLNDAVLIAPSSLLVPAVTWAAVDDRSFDVTLTDEGLVSRARVELDDADRVVDFRTEDRYGDFPGGSVRAPWHTPVGEWTDRAGRVFPAAARAVWHLEDGLYEYARGAFVPETLVRNIPPSACAEALPLTDPA